METFLRLGFGLFVTLIVYNTARCAYAIYQARQYLRENYRKRWRRLFKQTMIRVHPINYLIHALKSFKDPKIADLQKKIAVRYNASVKMMLGLAGWYILSVIITHL
ncbi:MAG: hypothetical protein ACE5K9_07825 [Candidatus Methylomirabilales bacterium]